MEYILNVMKREETVDTVPGLVRDPFFVDVFVDPGHDSHDLPSPGANHNVTTHCIQHVNGLCLPAHIHAIGEDILIYQHTI